MADLSPIMNIFRAFELKYHRAGEASIDQEDADRLLSDCDILEKRMLQIPATDMRDFAAKMITKTRYGEFLLEEGIGDGGLVDEAVAILAGSPKGGLRDLIDAHAAALAAWDAVPDGEWDAPSCRAVDARLNEARDALLAHRPATIDDVRQKALYMASCRAFAEWDSDFDQVKLIEALMPAGGANA